MAKQPQIENHSADALVQLVITALMAALIFTFTFLPKVPIPGAHGGYVNLGDTVIFLAALFIGNPWAAAAAAIGSGLSDFLAGYTEYIIPTVLIKGIMGLVAAIFAKRDKPTVFKFGTFLCGIIMCGGYFGFALFYYKAGENLGWVSAVNDLPMNIAQAVVCMILSWLLYKPVLALKNKLIKQ
ncbi:MAG: ECF transporter S component [Oscillospiraceae bacterium]|jgi:uncharacterized membrane protein|nr:ECF transporter S component [Oscillospiraceae bacterium]